jgi:hypothetical protein
MPATLNVSGPDILSKINPEGQDVPEIYKAQQDALAGTEKFAQSLEDRYSNPNWYKIAAGFLKPQLGGFFASLGSAAQAAGESEEARRAVAPTIEKMRAEVAAGRAGLNQRVEQSRLLKEFEAGGSKDLNKLYQAYRLDPSSPAGQAISKRPDFEAARRNETQFNVDLQKEVLANPSLVINDPNYKYIDATPEESKKYVQKVNAARPEGYTPQEWNAMKFPEREDAIARFADAKSKEGMAEGTRFAAESGVAHDVLDDLSGLRQLATDPDIKPLFSLLQNGDLFSQIRAAVAQNPGKAQQAIEGLVNAKMDELKNFDPKTRAKADKLIKDIASLEVRLRGSLNNPTDAASLLSSQRSPTLANSQSGFVGILDQIAFNASRDIGIAKLHSQMRKQGLTSKDAAYADAMENYRNETRQLRRDLAKSNYDINVTPAWYDTRSQNARAQSASQEAAPANPPQRQPAARPSSVNLAPVTASSIAEERARRAAAQNRPQ